MGPRTPLSLLLLSYVGTKVMLFLVSTLIMMEMECVTKQQAIPLMDEHELTKCKETNVSEQLDRWYEEARKYRKHLAQEEALRQLQKRRSKALAAAHRMSFFH